RGPRGLRYLGELVQDRFEERLHRRRVVDAVSGKCRLGAVVGLPVEERVAGAADLDIFGTLPRLDQGIDERLAVLVADQAIRRAADLELRHRAILRGG